MRIATFGSCLSRFVGGNFTYLFGGQIVSSVYHNRSDVYTGRFLDGTVRELELKFIKDKLKPLPPTASLDNDPSRIIKNQLRRHQGKHRLRRGVPFFDLLDQGGVELVIFDNYMDLSARLLEINNTPEGTRWFIRPDDLADPTQCSVGDLLSPEVGAESMLKIIRYVRSKIPHAKLVFCNFPHNTYYASPDRVARAKLYEKLMSEANDDTFLTIPCLDVPERFQTHERQHFKPEMYCGYAGVVWDYLRRSGQ